MAAAVQFYGSDTVVKAFEAREIPIWAIFQQRQMCTAGTGSEALQEYLDMLKSNPVPVYTLKVYKHAGDPDDITDRTECNGSFNFKIDSDAVSGRGSSGEGGSVASRVLRRLDDMEAGLLLKRLDSIEERMTKESSESIDVIGAVNNLLQDPASLVQVINGIKMLFSPARTAQAVGMSSLPGSHGPDNANLNDKIERLQNAINILEQNDPLLIEHLEKLARLSQDKKHLFTTLIGMLDGMQ